MIILNILCNSQFLGGTTEFATIHFVDEKYDSGPILAQRVVPVRADDTPSDLAARVLKEVCVFFSFLSFN
jgi:folate-dependent phosphoribosylglycinamide formyltransferase PurN